MSDKDAKQNNHAARTHGDVVLSASDLELYRDGRRVLRLDVLTLRKSSIAALLGPNGCGKSTLLKTLSGFLRPRSGRVVVLGHDLYPSGRCDGSVRKHVVLVHQRPTVFDRSVLGNVAYGLRRQGVGKRQAHKLALEALEDAGLTELKDRPARRLSGGERRRMALVRALVLKPQVLLLDEPSAEVDEASMAWLASAVRRASAGRAVLLATHDADLAKSLADQVVELGTGHGGPGIGKPTSSE